MRAITVLAGASGLGLLVGFAPTIVPAFTPSYAETVSGCRVIDGDTIRCGEERIRLLGIDAPEVEGHCASYRRCAPGDGDESTTSLEAAMTGTLRIERVGEDRYSRTLAIAAGDLGDLSCWQLKHQQAIYKPRWDDGYRVARLCPSAL